MATWHQLKAGHGPLWHETEWTVVVDPPGQLLATISFTKEEDAREYAKKVPHSYVLSPANRKDRS